ncbi:MAG TPA: hypothetical protein DCE71_06405 [Parachlamydiales bacterium]|nr:hypothetical protein [Parachlamydiales bacterium]
MTYYKVPCKIEIPQNLKSSKKQGSAPHPAKGLTSSGLLFFYESSSAAEDDSIKSTRSPEDVSPLAGCGAEPCLLLHELA